MKAIKKKLKEKAWKIYHLFDEHYCQNFWLCYDIKDNDSLLKYINKQTGCDIKDENKSASTYCIKRNEGDYLVVIILWEQFKESDRMIGLLAHESLHAASYILNNCGVKFHDKSEEAYAYYLDMLMRKFSKVLKL